MRRPTADPTRAALPPGLLREMTQLYRRLEAELPADAACRGCSVCCDFPGAGHVLYAETLEIEYALHHAGELRVANVARGWCPFYVDGRCGNRRGRVLGCRTYFCAEGIEAACHALYERYVTGIRRLALRWGLPVSYEPFLSALARRCAGVTGRVDTFRPAAVQSCTFLRREWYGPGSERS